MTTAGWGRVVPAAAACAFLLLLIAKVWADKTYYTGGVFAYALDDAYIHMALAKNLAQHGVMGATPFEFTSSSSSPLWTGLLALVFRIVGVRDLVPLVLTSVSAMGVVLIADFVMRRFRVSAPLRLAALVWLCIATPLIAIIYGGMEHPLQIVIDVAFVYLAVRVLSRQEMKWDARVYALLALAAAVTAVRYEGALIVMVVAAALVLRKRWGAGVAIAVAGAAPITAFGFYSLSQGAFFLPNSVLVKGASSLADALVTGGLGAYASALSAQAATAYPVYLLLIANIVLGVAQLRAGASRWSPTVVFPGIAVVVSAVHLMFGQVGWFYRYEDYMVVLLAVGLVVQGTRVVPRAGTFASRVAAVSMIGSVLLAGSVVAGVIRGWSALESTPRAIENVYEQMYQTAHFLKDNPQYTSVAVGDLGAVAYYNDDLRILDLEGLAERGVPLDSLGRENADAEGIAALARQDGCEIAIVFPDYFDLPDDWVEVARWTISNNIVAYGDTVAFLAIPPTDPEQLAADVYAYSVERLPPTVGAQGLSLDAGE